MRIRVDQFLVALPLTLVSTLGIAVGVQHFSLESADLLSIAPADNTATTAPLNAVQASVEGMVAPPPVRPVETAPALAAPAPAGPKAITGFTAPASSANPGAAPPGGANSVNLTPAPKAKTPAKTQRPKASVPQD